MNYIFGYGSLVGTSGINCRKMRRIYKPADLTECYLKGYVRNLNAGVIDAFEDDYWSGLTRLRFYGIQKGAGVVNGVIFPISNEDMPPFKASEGFYNPVTPYYLVDVTEQVNIKVPGRILTCVTRNPSEIGHVYNYYKEKVNKALKERSEQFIKEFSPKI